MSAVYIKTFKPGDLITMYRKGFYRFVKYIPRGTGSPLVVGRSAYNSKGKPCSAFEYECDAFWCDYGMNTVRDLEQELHKLQQMTPWEAPKE